jgi:hypothetical protein
MWVWLRGWLLRWGALFGVRFALVFAGLLVGLHLEARVHELNIDMEAQIPSGAVAQVFYTFDGRSYYPENSRILLRQVQDGKIRFTARIRTTLPIRSIRLDPSNKEGEVLWQSLALVGASGRIQGSGVGLQQLVQQFTGLQILDSGSGGQRMLATTADPQMIVMVPPEMTDIPAGQRIVNSLVFLLFSLGVAAALEGCFRVLRREHPLNIRISRWLSVAARGLSDDATIRFSASAVLVYVVLLVLSVVWVGLKLNLSSIGVWDGMYPGEPAERVISLGSPKGIRSDEWGTLTPWMLSQAQNGMRSDNPNIGAAGSPVLAGVPVQSPLMLAQPKYWGFFLLDLERGFSWVWAFKAFGLVAAFFTLLLLVTGGNTPVALGGAIAMYGASYVQWWLSSVPSESVSGFSMAVVGACYLLQGRKTGGMWFGALVVPLSVCFLLLHMYPPYLLALAYLSLFMLVGMLSHREALSRFVFRLPLRLGLVAVSLLATSVFAWLFYREVHGAAEVMLNTDYPGRRYSLGGDFPLQAVFYGVFESWKINDDVTPFPPTNPSEVSNFWVLFPLALLLVPVRRWLQPSYRLLAALLAFCLLCLVWMSLPLPPFLRSAMAQTGWFIAPAARVQFGLAVGSAVLMAVLVASVARGSIETIRVSPIWVAGGVFLGVVAFGLYLQTLDAQFFTLGRCVLGAAFVAAFAWVAQRGWSRGFLWLSIAIALPTLYVNPVQSGLAPYLNKDIFLQARRVVGDGQALWAVYGDIQLAQGFKGAGLQVLNGTNYAPRQALFDVLDPQNQHKETWNRYAHIELVQGQEGQPPGFELRYPDHYRIMLDVCGPHIRRLGVTHVAYAYQPSANETRCLQAPLVKHFSGVSLYPLSR